MSLLVNSAHRQETSMQPALRRARRFAIVSAVAICAMFAVLAVKAQVVPHPRSWVDTWPGYDLPYRP